MELKHQNLVFTSLLLKKCHGVKQNAKKCAIGEAECNEILSLYLRKTENYQKKKKGWGRGRRERIEKGSREKRKETKGS